jgi:hypothetical protein
MNGIDVRLVNIKNFLDTRLSKDSMAAHSSVATFTPTTCELL